MKINKKFEVATKAAQKAPTSKDAAEALKIQYEIVVKSEAATFRERVKFGAMLIQWEQYLGGSRGVNHGGEGLKGWLEENCPEIGYASAMAYKGMAERAIKMLGGGQMATAALMGDDTVRQPDGETVDVESDYVAKADALFEKADSRRKLEQMWFEFSKGVQRRKGLAKAKIEAAGEAALSAEESALIGWDEFLAPVVKKRGVYYSAAKFLPVNAAENFLAELEALVAVLKKRLAK